MDFTVFDTKRLMSIQSEPKNSGDRHTSIGVMRKRQKTGSIRINRMWMKNFMLIFAEFGKMRTEEPASEKYSVEVEKLQNFTFQSIFYQCSIEVLSGLGQMYASGGEFHSEH